MKGIFQVYKIGTEKELVAEKVTVADSFLKRLQGLMFRPSLAKEEGLLISPCNSIHMMFMRFPIDAIFLNTEKRIIALYQNLSPWFGITSIHGDAAMVLELHSGIIEEKSLAINDQLSFESIN
jgi:hypothetical protein